MTTDQFTDKFGHDWNEESLHQVKEILKDDRSLAREIASELYVEYRSSEQFLYELFTFLKDLDKDLAINLAKDEEFPISEGEIQELFAGDKFAGARDYNNTSVRKFFDKQFLEDDKLFEQEFGNYDGKDALARIKISSKDLGIKIYQRHKAEILKRLSVAGQEESKNIRELIELGVLEITELNRAIKRMLKQSPSYLPLNFLVETNLFSEDEIFDFIRQKGITQVFDEGKVLPESIGDRIIEENISDSELLFDGVRHNCFSKKQRVKIIKSIDSLDVLNNGFELLTQDEKELACQALKNKKVGDVYYRLIDNIAKIDEKFAIKVLEQTIKEQSYIDSDLMSCVVADGNHIYSIFLKNPNSFALEIAEKYLDKLRSSGRDEEFVKIALEKAPKKELMRLNELLIDYLSEEEQEKMYENYVKSIDGALECFRKEVQDPKIRSKALARISSSTDSILEVMDYLSEDEVDKLLSYKKTTELMSSNPRLLNSVFAGLSSEKINEYFTPELLTKLSAETLAKVKESSLTSAAKQAALNLEAGFSHDRDLLNIKNDTVARSILKNVKNPDVLFAYPHSYAAQYLHENISSISTENGLSKSLQKNLFILKSKPTNEDFKLAVKAMKDSSANSDLLTYIDQYKEDFFQKWTEDQREALIELFMNYFEYSIDYVTFFSGDLRKDFFNSYLENFKLDTMQALKKLYGSSLFSLSGPELEKIKPVILKNEEALGYIISCWEDSDLKKIISIDSIVNKIMNDQVEITDMSKKVIKRISLFAVRQQKEKLIQIILNSYNGGFDFLSKHIETEEEAEIIFTLVKEKTSNSSYSWSRRRNGYNAELESILKFFTIKKNFDFKDEVSDLIHSAASNNSRNTTNPSDLFSIFNGKFNADRIPSILTASSVKAETKRMIDVLLELGYSREVHLAILNNAEKFDGILTKREISSAYTPEVISELIKPDMRWNDMKLVLTLPMSNESIQNKLIIQSMSMKSLKITSSSGELIGSISDQKVFSYDMDSTKIAYFKGNSDIEELIREHLKLYVELLDTAGTIDLKTKIITKNDGTTFDLNNHHVIYTSENESELEQILGMMTFGVPVKTGVKVFLNSAGSIVCRVSLEDKVQPPKESSFPFQKMEALLERKIEQLETDFVSLLGKIKSDRPFGIEMEFISNLNRSDLAGKIGKSLKSEKDFNIVGIDDYKKTVGDDWEIKMDSSVRVEEGQFSAEVVSPKLYGEEGINRLEKVLDILVKLSKKSVIAIDKSCGIHVHHDIRDVIDYKQNLNSIAEVLYAIQGPLYSIVGNDRAKNSYSSKMEHNSSSMNLKYESRKGFNMGSKNTIEFRMKEGSLDPKSIIRWVRLTKSIVEEIKDLYKKNALKIKKNVKESLSNALQAILVEKALQTKQNTGIEYSNINETYEALMFSELLLSEVK